MRVALNNLVPTALPSSCSIGSDANVICSLGMLAGSSAASVSIGVAPVLPGTATATATISAHVPDESSANDTSSASIAAE